MAYVANDPVNGTDPTGKAADTCAVMPVACLQQGGQTQAAPAQGGPLNGQTTNSGSFTPSTDPRSTAIALAQGGYYEGPDASHVTWHSDATATALAGAKFTATVLGGEAIGAAIGAVKVGAAAAEGTTTLFRAVMPGELKSIQGLKAFSNPTGIESKYFSTTLAGARSYAAQAAARYGDGPFSIVRTTIPTGSISPSMFSTVDRGIPAVVVSTEQLSLLSTPTILP